MEQYLRRNRISEVLDGLGVRAAIYGAATLWFVWLWGMGWPAVLAGLALGTLGQMVRSRCRQRSVARREKALRARLGGEMMLEAMLLSEAKEAHFRAALLLAERWPLTLCEAGDAGVTCKQGDETLLVQCLRMPAENELSAGDLLAGQRAVKRAGADRGVLCVLGKVAPKVAAKAEQTPVPLRLVQRETLLDIAGSLSPATDAQLIELGKRRRRPVAPGGGLRLVFRRDKARRYWGYGTGMLLLYVLTSLGVYAVMGMVCLAMAVGCCMGRQEPEGL